MSRAKPEKLEEKSLKAALKETISMLIWALGIALVLRTFLFQPFHIPSGSMEPSLVKGDYIITTKYSVGYGRYAASPLPFPVKNGRLFERTLKRGDVLVFRPEGNPKTYIKRLAGLPGDQIQMKDGVLNINGSPVMMDSPAQTKTGEIWTETFPGGTPHLVYDKTKGDMSDNTRAVIVPSGHYFFLGDNRDESADSRVSEKNGGAGLVPATNIIGRAEFVLMSANEKFSLVKPWTWGQMRGGRFFKGLR